MKLLRHFGQQARKATVAAIGLLATLEAQGLIDDPQTARWVAVIVAAGTALGVYAVPNEPPAGQ